MDESIGGPVSSQAGGLVHFHQRGVPLPALANAGQGPVHAREEQQDLEDQHHGGHDQAEHVARGGVPLIGGGAEKLVPPVDVAMSGAYEQGQVAQLRLRRKNHVTSFMPYMELWEKQQPSSLNHNFVSHFCVQMCCHGDRSLFFSRFQGKF